MPPKDAELEARIAEASEALDRNPKLKVLKAARDFKVPYDRLRMRRKGRPPSSSRGGHNKKLCEPQDDALKSYLLLLHSCGTNGNLDHLILAANRVLFYSGSAETVSKRCVCLQHLARAIHRHLATTADQYYRQYASMMTHPTAFLPPTWMLPLPHFSRTSVTILLLSARNSATVSHNHQRSHPGKSQPHQYQMQIEMACSQLRLTSRAKTSRGRGAVVKRKRA
jgi:hypothetical protein